MRQRSYATPQPARMVSAANAPKPRLAPAEASAQGASAAMKVQPAQGPRYLTPCGCGGQSGCSHCGGCGVRMFPPALYDADGSCAEVFDISCDTRWRVRECFKRAFCDLLRCFGDQLCDDGKFVQTPKPDFGDCLEGFVCSLVTCLPDAICPPPQKECCEAAPPSPCAPRLPAPGCDCNYAVEE